MRNKYEGFPIGTLSSSSARTGTRYNRIVRCAGPFGRTSLIAFLPVLELSIYLADFHCLQEAEATICEGLVADREVYDALELIGLNKLPGQAGLPYEVYLRRFLPMTNMFSYCFAQGAILGVITLLEKGGVHVWEDLDDNRSITFLNTDLTILVRVLANCLQLVISDLIGPEQNYAVKRRSIQDNLHLVREVLTLTLPRKDDTKSGLINLVQAQALNRVDHRFLVTVLQT